MIRRPPIATRTDTLFPYTTLFRDLFDDLPELVELTGTDGRRRRYNVIPARRDGRVGWMDPAGFELAQSDDIFDEFGPGAIRSDYELRTDGRGAHVHRIFAAGG